MTVIRRIFIDTNNYSEERFNDIIKIAIKASTYNTQLVLGTNDENRFEKLKNEFSDNIEIYKRPLSFYNDRTNHKLNEELIIIIQNVLNNEATALLFDRHHQKVRNTYYGNGMQNYFRYVTALVVENHAYFKSLNLDYIYFSSTPHQIESWVSSLVAESLGITAVLQHLSPVPWRRSLYFGLGKDRRIYEIQDENISKSNEDVENLNNWIKKVKGDYIDAIPDYEKKRLEFNRGKYFNLFAELKRYWLKPHYILNKYRCFQTYSKLSIKLIKESYVVFFLHYQPERTTLPEGYGFTEQTIVILAMRAALPDNIKIIVKEHPSTFTNMCAPKHRHPSFYKDILAIKNVELADISISSFELIDNAIASVTITGSVGVETLLRGKPTVFMGVPIIKNTSGVHTYENVIELKKFFHECIIGFNKMDIILNTEKTLHNYMRNSVSVYKNHSKNEKLPDYKWGFLLLESFIESQNKTNLLSNI